MFARRQSWASFWPMESLGWYSPFTMRWVRNAGLLASLCSWLTTFEPTVITSRMANWRWVMPRSSVAASTFSTPRTMSIPDSPPFTWISLSPWKCTWYQ